MCNTCGCKGKSNPIDVDLVKNPNSCDSCGESGTELKPLMHPKRGMCYLCDECYDFNAPIIAELKREGLMSNPGMMDIKMGAESGVPTATPQQMDELADEIMPISNPTRKNHDHGMKSMSGLSIEDEEEEDEEAGMFRDIEEMEARENPMIVEYEYDCPKCGNGCMEICEGCNGCDETKGCCTCTKDNMVKVAKAAGVIGALGLGFYILRNEIE